jgi:hypothetical protein
VNWRGAWPRIDHVGAAAADAEDLSYDSQRHWCGGYLQFALLPKNLALTRLDIEIV